MTHKTADAMRSLCEDISAAREARKRDLKDLKEQVKAARDNAREFIGRCGKVRGEMAESLAKGLKDDREELARKVSSIREDIKQRGKEIRADLAEAAGVWGRMRKTFETGKRGEIK